MIGGLVGSNSAAISDSTSSATVSSSVAASDVGGLVGTNASAGSISLSYDTGAVTTGSNTGTNVGGLVGLNQGNISNVYSMATITARIILLICWWFSRRKILAEPFKIPIVPYQSLPAVQLTLVVL